MTDDAQLLRQYVETGSEAAFAELVQRHLALVYHAAARQLGPEAHLASDVAQSVFVLLAAKSRSLLHHPSLAAWLHATTHFKVAELRRAENRRRAREQVAHYMHDLRQKEPNGHDWEQLRPMIDDVLLELNESDREAVLLRYFQDRPFAEIAARLRLSENTAHKRVERALENLRTRLSRRGVKSTAAALATALGSHAALAAPPAGLAASVTGAVVSSGLPGAAAWSVLSVMSTKTTATVTTVVVALAGGAALQQVNAERAATAALAAVEQENTALVAQIRAAEASRPAPRAAANVPPAATVSSATSEVARRLGTGGFASVEESQAFLRANPEVRAVLADYLRGELNEQYAELFPALGLTDVERDQFLAILASGMRHIVGEHQFSIHDDPVTGADLTRQLRALLGDARYQQYRSFGDTATARNVARELTRSLYFTPAPLTSAQADELKRIVAQTVSDPSLGAKYTGGWPHLPAPMWDKIISDTRVALTDSQVEALRELQERSRFFHLQSAASREWRAKQKENTK